MENRSTTSLATHRQSHLRRSALLLAPSSPRISAWLNSQLQSTTPTIPPQAYDNPSPPPSRPSCPHCGTLHILNRTLVLVKAADHPLGLRGTRCAACHRFCAFGPKPGRADRGERGVASVQVEVLRGSAVSGVGVGGEGGNALERLTAGQRKRARARARRVGLMGGLGGEKGSKEGIGKVVDGVPVELLGRRAVSGMGNEDVIVSEKVMSTEADDSAGTLKRREEEKGAFGLGLFDFME